MIVHLNGQLLPLDQARISPLDRGFVFGDGVYEGLRSIATSVAQPARVVGLRPHIRRMQAGLDEVGIAWDAAAIGRASLELLEANGLRDAFIYWQVTRGTPPAGEPVRSRVPAENSTMRPTVFGYCTPQPALESVATPPVKRAVLVCDDRWRRGHLKSISLIGNVAAALQTDAAGADEAIFVRPREGNERGDWRRGLVSEGLATNVLAVVPGRNGRREIVTPSLSSVSILAGITRAILLREVPELVERPLHAEELEHASEILYVGTTTLVTAVTQLDGRTIGDGTPGPEARRLLGVLINAIRDGRDDW